MISNNYYKIYVSVFFLIFTIITNVSAYDGTNDVYSLDGRRIDTFAGIKNTLKNINASVAPARKDFEENIAYQERLRKFYDWKENSIRKIEKTTMCIEDNGPDVQIIGDVAKICINSPAQLKFNNSNPSYVYCRSFNVGLAKARQFNTFRQFIHVKICGKILRDMVFYSNAIQFYYYENEIE